MWLMLWYSSAVIDHLKHEILGQAIGLAFMYCSYKEREEQTLVNIVASLARQLMQQDGVIPDNVRIPYKRHQEKGTRPTLVECTQLLFSQLNTCSRVFVIVDVLDECTEYETRNDLLSELLRLPPTTALMITSRPIPGIDLQLSHSSQIDIHANDDDIRIYLERRLKRRADRKHTLNWTAA
jgi:hypothetical protein